MKKIHGLIAAAYTPFNEQGDIDLLQIEPYARYLKHSGVTGVFVNGTTGEGLSLLLEERLALTEAWVRYQSDDFRIFIHVGHSSLPAACRLAKHAEDVGVDGIGALSPVFFKPNTIHHLVQFNKELASAAPALPYYYYHIPSMTGVNFPMIDFLEYAGPRIPNLQGIKFTSDDLMDMKLCLEFNKSRYDVLHGKDEILLSGLILGVSGAIGSTYNYMAPLFTEMVYAFEQGELEEAKRLQSIAIKIIRVLIKYGGGISGGKAIMNLIGFHMGLPRLPIDAISKKEMKSLEQELRAHHFFNYTLQ